MCMLDATCGSGTFLAHALDKDMNAGGNDIKDKYVDDTIRNRRFPFEAEVFENNWKLENQEFSLTDHYADAAKYYCAVANLPWGKNTKIVRNN